MKFITDKSTLSDKQLFDYWQELTGFLVYSWHGESLEDVTREHMEYRINRLENIISKSCHWCNFRVSSDEKQVGCYCPSCNMFFCAKCKFKEYFGRPVVELDCVFCKPSTDDIQ